MHLHIIQTLAAHKHTHTHVCMHTHVSAHTLTYTYNMNLKQAADVVSALHASHNAFCGLQIMDNYAILLMLY